MCSIFLSPFLSLSYRSLSSVLLFIVVLTISPCILPNFLVQFALRLQLENLCSWFVSLYSVCSTSARLWRGERAKECFSHPAFFVCCFHCILWGNEPHLHLSSVTLPSIPCYSNLFCRFFSHCCSALLFCEQEGNAVTGRKWIREITQPSSGQCVDGLISGNNQTVHKASNTSFKLNN